MFQVQMADLHGQRLEAGCAPTGNLKIRFAPAKARSAQKAETSELRPMD
jgi:hypothetical protein